MTGTQVSLIIPTYNEAGNVRPFIASVSDILTDAYGSAGWEIIFVDDNSSDGTANIARQISKSDPRIRVLQRIGRRGLSSAVMEGFLAASADICVVMDGDLQHDPQALLSIIKPLQDDDVDIVIASRFADGGTAQGLSSEARRKASNRGIRLVNLMFGLSLTDPLTGYFGIRRQLAEDLAPRVSQYGFKILIDLIVSSENPLRVTEVPFTFYERHSGESKLDTRVIFDFFLFLVERTIGKHFALSPRFISFLMVGSLGVILHLFIMSLIFSVLGRADASAADSASLFTSAQTLGAFGAMFFNFFLNNLLTYRDKQLRGFKFFTGFIIFAALCSIGLIANVGVASAINNQYSALWAISALGGILVGTVWNYAATRRYVWNTM